MLPTITWGGQEFYDISGIVTPNRYTRAGTDGVAIHHSVAQTEFPDRNANGTSLDEQIEHVKAINAFHISKGYGGFGYNGIAFRDGTVMTVGKAEGARAHVANHNNHLTGICMAGTFTDQEVPIGLVLGVARFLAAVEHTYGVRVTKAHRRWVTDPAWATACCGDRGEQAIGQMLMAKSAIIAKANDALDAEVRARIAAALRENAAKGDLEGLAGQIKYITGGRLC